ncbi:glycosyltransferase [Echinicola sp. CAU 1574]|uniref:Glycosyltransferase n=1 Tax=Echinicola arenosa TaxID=2774144 RepID=A0ABR9AQ49_9BACT|nr:glycosyltransferase [Echinicola arenosa]MBD8490897.1 glycosyltransferase [Echinicola arenosa]
MAKNKELILLTKRFPFFKTEAFLESEIDILAEHFDTIRIFPYEIGNYCRQVPENVVVDTTFSRVYQRKKSRAIQTLVSREFRKAVADHFSHLKGPKDLNMLLKFVSNARAYYCFFEQQLEVINKEALIYTYWFNEATYALLNLKLQYGLAVNIISRAHRFDIYEQLTTTRSFWPYRRFCLENIDRLYSISEDGKHYLEKRYKVQKEIEIARLGVHDRQKMARRSSLGIIQIVSVSRIAPMKRVDFIRQAVLQYAFEHPNNKIVWTHFGDGPGMEELNQTSDIPENLVMDFKGHVKNDEVYGFYEQHSVDLFINLSSSEGIPVSIMEAISFGIPIVVTKVGGTGEIVSEVNGKLLSANPTLEEVVKAFSDVIKRKLQAEEIRRFFNSHYNANTNYQAFAKSLAGIKEAESAPVDQYSTIHK